MAKPRACKNCKAIFEGDKCPKCGSTAFSDSFKGRVVITNPEGEIAKELKVNEKGTYAIKL